MENRGARDVDLGAVQRKAVVLPQRVERRERLVHGRGPEEVEHIPQRQDAPNRHGEGRRGGCRLGLLVADRSVLGDQQYVLPSFVVLLKPDEPVDFDTLDPDNVSPLIVWLGSDDCDVSGEIFEVTGGRLGIFEAARRGPLIERDARWTPAEIGPAARQLVAERFFVPVAGTPEFAAWHPIPVQIAGAEVAVVVPTIPQRRGRAGVRRTGRGRAAAILFLHGMACVQRAHGRRWSTRSLATIVVSRSTCGATDVERAARRVLRPTTSSSDIGAPSTSSVSIDRCSSATASADRCRWCSRRRIPTGYGRSSCSTRGCGRGRTIGADLNPFYDALRAATPEQYRKIVEEFCMSRLFDPRRRSEVSRVTIAVQMAQVPAHVFLSMATTVTGSTAPTLRGRAPCHR